MKGVLCALVSVCLGLCTASWGAEMILDHEVVLGDAGQLMPWTPYERIITGSMNYIKTCPLVASKHGEDPLYLVTSKLTADGAPMDKQNNQGSNAFYAVETLRRYYAFTGDQEAFGPVRALLDRVMEYTTPADWDWANVPRTQDDSPDGVYDDAYSEPDKMCMVGTAYLRFARMTGEDKYVLPALAIAQAVRGHFMDGGADVSPMPFRVDLKTGKVLDMYTADMVFGVIFFEELARLDTPDKEAYAAIARNLWAWVLAYPVKNQRWSGYYEDVASNKDNCNQQVALEAARYMLGRLDDHPEYRDQIPAILDWVKNRFGQTKHFGATSIREQDGCFKEMSSHTARYASVVAGWWAYCEDHQALTAEQRAELYEEARASLALCTYSTWNKYSKGDRALNYTGIGYIEPWFSDSYFDMLPHYLDCLAAMPGLLAKDQARMIHSSGVIKRIAYDATAVAYEADSDTGEEWLWIPAAPRVKSGDAPLPAAQWTYGARRGVDGILCIQRNGQRSIQVAWELPSSK